MGYPQAPRLSRRAALQGVLATGLASPLGAPAGAATAPRAGSDLKTQFAEALGRDPYLLAYRSAERPVYRARRLRTRGRWPNELRGSLYRNGPARHEIGDFRYQHWFDGDGMLQAFHVDGGRIEHRARFVETHKYVKEKAAGRPIYAGFGTAPPEPVGVTSADDLNVANISVLHHNETLFALWEAGSPWRVDARTLETQRVGVFSEETRGAPFSAHPRVEPDGQLWNFGYVSPAKKILLWHLGPDGRVRRTGLIDCDPISMVHDFVVTERFLVLVICPLHYEPTATDGAPPTNFLDLHRWRGEDPTQVLVVDKNDFSKVQRLELPAQWIFHFSNAWEDSAGVIRFEAASAADPAVLQTTFRDIMAGRVTPAAASRLSSYRIDTRRGRVDQTVLRPQGAAEFPIVSPDVVGRRHRRLLMLTERRSPHSGLNQVTLLDPSTADERSYRYPDHLIPEEHLLVGRGKTTGDEPWILGTALNVRRRRGELFLFDARALDAGPVASASLPYALPVGLHAKFVAA
ncbi:MAG: carotenoid oxygenase family protein [Pseudomonadota bacterium]